MFMINYRILKSIIIDEKKKNIIQFRYDIDDVSHLFCLFISHYSASQLYGQCPLHGKMVLSIDIHIMMNIFLNLYCLIVFLYLEYMLNNILYENILQNSYWNITLIDTSEYLSICTTLLDEHSKELIYYYCPTNDVI